MKCHIPDERRALLLTALQSYLRSGYQVLSQTDTTAQLIKPKQLSCFWLLVGVVTGPLTIGVGWIILAIYLLLYFTGKAQTVYLQIDENGKASAIRI